MAPQAPRSPPPPEEPSLTFIINFRTLWEGGNTSPGVAAAMVPPPVPVMDGAWGSAGERQLA